MAANLVVLVRTDQSCHFSWCVDPARESHTVWAVASCLTARSGSLLAQGERPRQSYREELFVGAVRRRQIGGGWAFATSCILLKTGILQAREHTFRSSSE